MNQRTASPSNDPNFDELRRRSQNAQVAQMTAAEDLRIALNRLEGAARPVCSKCMNLRYTPEYGYTFCQVIGNVSGRFRSLDSIAKLEGGKFVCSSFAKGGKLEGSP